MPYFNICSGDIGSNTVCLQNMSQSRSVLTVTRAKRNWNRSLSVCSVNRGYEYLPIHTEKDLIANLRKKLEELNNYQFSDTEWNDFFKNAVANPNEHIVEKTRKIQEDNIQVLTRDDGSSKNITLIDKKNIHNNRLQVINQYVIGTVKWCKGMTTAMMLQ
mgnify:CR=1 FL=1